VGSYQLKENDDKAAIPEFKLDQKGWRSLYQGPSATVELFAYQSSEREKKTIYSDVQQALVLQGGFSLAAGGLVIHTRANGNVLIFDQPASAKTTEQHGAFLWDRGWLLYCRSSAHVPSSFLKEYLETFGRAPAGEKMKP
jgi:hypothetical protein